MAASSKGKKALEVGDEIMEGGGLRADSIPRSRKMKVPKVLIIMRKWLRKR